MNNFHVYEAIGRGKHSVTPLSAFLSSSSLCSPRPRIRSDWVQMGEISDLFLVFFFFGCGGPEDGVQGAEEEEHRVLRRQERRQVAAVQGPQ